MENYDELKNGILKKKNWWTFAKIKIFQWNVSKFNFAKALNKNEKERMYLRLFFRT